MNIEIIESGTENCIVSYNVESNPFKVGETIHVRITNLDKEFWDVKDLRSSFIINKIEHYYREDYQFNRKCSIQHTVSVEVTKID